MCVHASVLWVRVREREGVRLSPLCSLFEDERQLHTFYSVYFIVTKQCVDFGKDRDSLQTFL